MLQDTYYKDLEQTLFKYCKNRDFIHFYVTLYFSHLSKRINYDITPTIVYGNLDQGLIKLLPPPGTLVREGYQFFTTLLEIYNKDYWLIKLWIKMYQDASGSKVGREIVRAFIKNCIAVTAERFVTSGELEISSATLRTNQHLLTELSEYYKRIFTISSIWKKMRRRYRLKVVEKYERKKQQSLFLTPEFDPDIDGLNALFSANGLSEYKELALLSLSQNNRIGIQDPIEFLLFFISSLSGKNKIKRQILNLL